MNAMSKIAENPDEIVVRVGTQDDVHRVMDLALLACEDNGLVRPNPEKLLQDVWSALSLFQGVCGIVGPHEGPLEGMVLIRMGTLHYSDEMVLQEKAIYVRPEFRSAKGGRANKLCKFSMMLSDELGLPLLIGILSSARTESKVRMYSRMLGPPSGANWIYGAKTGSWSAKEGE